MSSTTEDISVVVNPPDEVMTAAEIDLSFAYKADADDDSFSFSLTNRPIEVVKRYENWCVLSVARGNGPRAVEEWIANNESSCFESKRGDLQESSTPETNLPAIANPHNAAVAHSLLLVARNQSFLQELQDIRVTVHCLVKGYFAPGTEIKLVNSMEGRLCQTNAVCLEVVPSNSAGHVSLLAAHNKGQFIAPRQFRRHLQSGGWPVLGASRDCLPFRGEKMCLSVVGLEFQAKGIEKRQYIYQPAVPKLRRILAKEERFWKEKQGVDEVRKELFSSEVPRPAEYVNEKAAFDGLELRVTPDVMIPRKGSEALVEIVDQFYSSKDCTEKSPLILDLGTGSGNLLLAILKRLCHLNAVGVGVDASRDALNLCDYNIAALGLNDRAKTIQGKFQDIGHLKHAPFDVVVCNPPYISNRGQKRNLDAATSIYEPEKALYVDREERNIHYEHIVEGIVKGNLLVPGALLVFEVCRENANAVEGLLTANGFHGVTVGRDWKRCIRTVHGYYLHHSSNSMKM
mmetsp:Transcript_93242/g.269300  ORF Transcript_93242/g.269300 Transcript_93242/m.269300 type:complete len:515 (+) Transcript_93242:395-1939(+)